MCRFVGGLGRLAGCYACWVDHMLLKKENLTKYKK